MVTLPDILVSILFSYLVCAILVQFTVNDSKTGTLGIQKEKCLKSRLKCPPFTWYSNFGPFDNRIPTVNRKLVKPERQPQKVLIRRRVATLRKWIQLDHRLALFLRHAALHFDAEFDGTEVCRQREGRPWKKQIIKKKFVDLCYSWNVGVSSCEVGQH